MAELSLPPIYRQVRVAEGEDPFDKATRLAKTGGHAATFFWADTASHAVAAIVLEPDRPAADAIKVVLVALAGVGDALGALVPAAVPVLFCWPDRIELDGGLVGRVRLVSPPGDETGIPDWLVVGLELAVQSAGTAPGNRPEVTTLHDEGCGDVSAVMVLEAFSRHFLYWMNRWNQDGFGVVRASWLPRVKGRDDEADFDRVGGPKRARIMGLDANAGLLVRAGETAPVVLPLADSLRVSDGPV